MQTTLIGLETKQNKLTCWPEDFLFIDHHPCAVELKALHLIDSNFAATGEIVANLVKEIEVEFTEMAHMPLHCNFN